VAVPTEPPVTTPDVFTDATEVFEELHVTFLLVAFEGKTVAARVVVLPTLTLADAGLTVTLVTATAAPANT
jgi:hypothetical protein